jgi:putative transposase
MRTGKNLVEQRLEHWAKIMEERVASGQSIQAYCREKGLRANVYHYWQRKLRGNSVQQLSAKPARQTNLPEGWVTIEHEGVSTPEKAIGLTLRIGGAEIQVYRGFDKELLVSVCRTLAEKC